MQLTAKAIISNLVSVTLHDICDIIAGRILNMCGEAVCVCMYVRGCWGRTSVCVRVQTGMF
jgi:hypothetical protein